MAKIDITKLPGFKQPVNGYSEDWSQHSGEEVQEFLERMLKSKVGYFFSTAEALEDGSRHRYGFADSDSYAEWASDPDANAALILTDEAIAEGGGSGQKSYVLQLLTSSPLTIVSTGDTVALYIRFTSKEYDPITQSTIDTLEEGTLTVQTRTADTQPWQTAATLAHIPSDLADGQYKAIDITDLLQSGYQQVRVSVKGDTTGLVTRFIMFNITKTDLGLSFASNWETPINKADAIMRLNYLISGAVAKTLHILIDGEREVTRAVGRTTYTETPLQIEVADGVTDTHKVMTHGVHAVEAWLTVDDTTIETEHVHSQVMVADSESTDQKAYMILNDVAASVANWTQARLFTYAVYSPTGDKVPLKMLLGDTSLTQTYMTFDQGEVSPNTRYTLQTMVEIDSELEAFDAYVHFQSGESQLHSKLKVAVDNAENFAPVSGADFILNPRLRSNEETDPRTILNAAKNNAAVESKWEGFSMKTDGWIIDEDGNRCLRVNAGSLLTINYETLQDYIGTDNHRSVTVEFDIRTRNATDLKEAVLRCCSYMDDGLPVGFELRPDSMAFLTVNKRELLDQSADIDQNEHTHIAFSIVYGISINGTPMNFVRLFINGKQNREFEWEPNDTFVRFVDGKQTSQGIRIGSDSCDIDIYSIRVIRRALSEADIRRDHIATLPTVAEKRLERDRNDICDDSGRINRAKAEAKGYNTLTYIGVMPSYYTGNIKVLGSQRFHRNNDPSHSGMIYNIERAGQGTSSRLLQDWNQQDKDTDDTVFVDENGVSHGSSVDIFPGLPVAKKRVAKANYASSQQCNKLGSCRAYHDLYRRIVGDTYISKTEGYENTRMAVWQEPVLGFHQETEDSEPVFCGLYTYGPGKGDKPTFGYDRMKFPDFAIWEGCDNGTPLTGFQVPWNGDVTVETNNDGDTFVMFNGGKQWELNLGDASRKTAVDTLKDLANFCYLHATNIKPFVGTLEELKAAHWLAEQDAGSFYFVTETSDTANRFDLFRLSPLTNTWVEAGVAKVADGKYESLNLATQSDITPTSTNWTAVCEQFKAWRLADFALKHRTEGHLHKAGALFHAGYTKTEALSDNRKKNTYLILDYVDDLWVFTFVQDDMDTRHKTNNVGRLTKPYYVEEHDKDENGRLAYWNGDDNVLWNLVEQAWPNELRAMVNRIMTEMANLSDGGTVLGFYEKYFFAVQRYFPAVAYNETARIRYETAAVAWKNGTYMASTHPMVQSLGDQLQGSRAWAKKRIIYMSSYASYGQFTMNGPGSLTFRAVTTTSGAQPSYSFKLTPAMALYPAVSSGSSTYWGQGFTMPQRVMEGETFDLLGVPGNNDQNVQIHGIDYFREIGDFSDKSLGNDFTISGERLTKFVAALMPKEFRPTRIIVTAYNLQYLDLRGCTSATGVLDLSMCTKLEYLNLEGTNFTKVILPKTYTLKEAYLGGRLTELELRDLGGLATLTADAVTYMESLTVVSCASMSMTLTGTGSALSKLVVEDCDLDPIAIINSHFPAANISQIRLSGIKVTQNSAFLSRLMDNNALGLDANGNPISESGKCSGLAGKWILTDLVTDAVLAGLKAYFPNLDLYNCQFSSIRFTDTEPNPANISCDENRSGYAYNNVLVPEGHFKRVIEGSKVYRCRYNDTTGKMSVKQLSDSTYRKYADGTDYDPTDAAGVGDDVMKLVKSCWYKGVNDFRNGQKYIFLNSYGDDPAPMSTATTTRRKKLSECMVREDAAYVVADVAAGDDAPAPATSSGGTCCYRTDIVDGMRQVRWPGVNNAAQGAVFLDAEDKVISKSICNVTDSLFDMQAGDYIFCDVPAGAKAMLFTGAKGFPDAEVIAVDSDHIEAIEPDWVNMWQFLLGVYTMSMDSAGRARSVSGGLARVGTKGGQDVASSAGWQYNAAGDLLNTSLPDSVPNWTQLDLLNACRLRGVGFHSVSYEEQKMVALIIYAMLGTRDEQSVIGMGRNGGAWPTGVFDANGNTTLTGASNGNLVWGLQNYVGCNSEVCDYIGISVESFSEFRRNRYAGVASDPLDFKWHIYNPHDGTERVVMPGYTGTDRNIARMRWGRFCDMVPSKVTGDSSMYNQYFCAVFGNGSPTKGRVFRRGGSNAYAVSGLACSTAAGGASFSVSSSGARLAFSGEIVIESS